MHSFEDFAVRRHVLVVASDACTPLVLSSPFPTASTATTQCVVLSGRGSRTNTHTFTGPARSTAVPLA